MWRWTGKREGCRSCALSRFGSCFRCCSKLALIWVKVSRKCCLCGGQSQVFTSVLVYIPDCSHSQRQAPTSSSWLEGAPPSSPSRATLPRRPGLQIPAETSALHPRPARLGCQLHGPTSCHKGSVDSVLRPSERRRHQRGGGQTSSSDQRRLLPGCEVGLLTRRAADKKTKQ